MAVIHSLLHIAVHGPQNAVEYSTDQQKPQVKGIANSGVRGELTPAAYLVEAALSRHLSQERVVRCRHPGHLTEVFELLLLVEGCVFEATTTMTPTASTTATNTEEKSQVTVTHTEKHQAVG
ncbi:MAG: hypothetical protein AAF152_02980 [Cyanobacteria bacterium P01_A01_bin.114]